ncbi:hypothetical protein BTZ20_4102 [Rhodococcus sp. MTM3W5.2]|uniref:DUF3558 domain-containing protein n=1 Tax=Rhodococcus sp. MTM3W5.2 TaxID=1805827 RepID=UPI0009793632|nr:DUF3558 domain-containing protein [Rhodococcus sp. MTM3W5.2]AQA21037.1 hypothetical protein BTZ20_4102 [Rhodococcus sp. MTM3W5.2]
MRLQLRGLAGFGLVCGALVLVGCGSETVAGEAEAVGAGAGEPVFSPCDDIPDEALRGVELDPATESQDIAGVKQPGWNICMWRGPEHALSIFATTYTMDDVRSNKKFEEFHPVDLGDRSGTSFRQVADKDRRDCDVALDSNGGAVMISISYLGGMAVVEEPCAVAARTARQLLPHIPS